MRPTLVSIAIGDHEIGIHSYGLLVAAGFAVAIWRLWREGRRQGFDGGRVLDLAFWSLIAGIGGSRVAFVLVNGRAFLEACLAPADGGAVASRFSGCLAPLRFWEGGLVFYGGAVGAGAVALWFCKRERWSPGKLGDVAAPALAIGHVLGRLGCLFAGCCFGAACGAPWGVAFPRGSVAFDDLQADGAIASGATHTMPLHPTQLYEAAGELAIFVLLLVLEARQRRRERAPISDSAEAAASASARPARPGHLFLVYVGAYAALRFVVEIFRGDAARGHLLTWTSPRLAAALGLPADQALLLSVSQLGSVLALGLVAFAAVRRRRRRGVAKPLSARGTRRSRPPRT
jgi:phosphatidylglycerol:prolipoprotein diacylglycerol transferase